MAIGTAAAIIGGAALSAGASIIGGNKASKAQRYAADQTAANERYFYNTTRADQGPYREYGFGALEKLSEMYGVPRLYRSGKPVKGFEDTADGMGFGDGGFEASPGYQFRLNEGVKAAERSAAARGLLGSGGTIKGIQRYGEGLASSEYENYANALRSMAGIGQTATQATSAAGASAAQGISNAFTNAGNARASSYANTGAAINNGVSNVMGAYLQGGFGGGGGASFNPVLPQAAQSQLSANVQMPSWYG